MDEKALLGRIAEGDEAAFRRIFDIYRERFYAAALKMTRSADMAEEIVQEVFVTLWIRRASLARLENPSSYLFTIVYHSIHARFKSMALERQMKKAVSEQYLTYEFPVEERLAGREASRLLHQVLQQLPPRQQLIYKLSREEGLSRDEIAASLHISPHTVKNHLQEAVKYVRARFRKVLSSLFFLA